MTRAKLHNDVKSNLSHSSILHVQPSIKQLNFVCEVISLVESVLKLMSRLLWLVFYC